MIYGILVALLIIIMANVIIKKNNKKNATVLSANILSSEYLLEQFKNYWDKRKKWGLRALCFFLISVVLTPLGILIIDKTHEILLYQAFGMIFGICGLLSLGTAFVLLLYTATVTTAMGETYEKLREMGISKQEIKKIKARKKNELS